MPFRSVSVPLSAKCAVAIPLVLKIETNLYGASARPPRSALPHGPARSRALMKRLGSEPGALQRAAASGTAHA